MKVQNTKREENSKNPDDLFVQEFFGSFNITIRNSIQSLLDLYQDKWSVRLMLLSFYFLEEKANEISINQVRDFAYGSPEIPGLVQKFLMENWSCFGGVKDKELVKFSKLITGSKHARNIPNTLCDEGLLMQQIGKNKELTPLGVSLCRYLHFKFLRENGFNLKILSDFYKNSHQNLTISEIPESLPERLNRRDCINMGVLIQISEEQFKFDPKSLQLYEFILDHPYIDIRASNTLKKEIIKTIHNNLIDVVGLYAQESPIIEGDILSLNRISDIKWIYKLGIRNYVGEELLKKWLTSLNSIQEKKKFRGFILQSEPGTGKTIWMLQQSLSLLLNNFMDSSSDKSNNFDINLIPLFLPLKNFTIREINEKFEIFYKEIRIVEIKDKALEHVYIREFWSKLLSIAYKGRELELWGRAFLKLFDKSNLIILGDGWDELTPNQKKFLTELILATIKTTNIKLTYLISTRYLEKSIKPLIQEKGRERNLIKLENPTKEQVFKYLEKIEAQWIKDEYSKDIIEKRFGNTLTPMNLWLLGLFPNFENLPKNRAELYERWIKYEALREISDKLNKKFGNTFLTTVRSVRNYQDLDVLLDEQVKRELDGKQFPLIQYIEGPIPGIVEKSKIKKQTDYGLLKLLPRLVYNRLSNPHYYENYHQIVQMNPLFNRFIRYYNDEKNRPNFILINSHYDYYLAALYCFYRYKDGLIFNFLERIDKKKGLDPDALQWDHFESTSSSLIKSLFMEILDITDERREDDIDKNISKEMILLRNIYESIPQFNDNAIGYPLNQNGPFIFKLKTKNFIDPHSEQVYKYYWNQYIKQKGVLPYGEDLGRFQCITNSLVNNEKHIRQFFVNILSFQGKYIAPSFTLDEILDKIDIETPHIIPILVYAYDINQTRNLSEPQIKILEKSDFRDLPWVKLWVYRAIIRIQPERIKELTICAIDHTYTYLLKYCALNIIIPLKKDIGDEIFDLSLKLFKRVSNRYKEIIIFQWASHLLIAQQLIKIKKLERYYHLGKKLSQKIIFALQYLLILHKILPDQLEYHLNLSEIPCKKVLFFLIDLYESKLISEEKLQKICLNKLTLNSVIYINRILSGKLDSFAYEGIKQKITPEFSKLCLKICKIWWKKNTPYQQKNIGKMFKEISLYFLKSGTYKENKEFENQKFRLKKYLENLNVLPESDKKYIFLEGKKFLSKLFKSVTRAQDFFEVFYDWLIDWGNKNVLIEFYYEFKDYFDFDDFFFRAKSRINNEKMEEISSLIIECIKKSPKRYFLSEHFNSRRRTHPRLASEDSLFNDLSKFKLLRILPEEQLYELLLNTFDLNNNDDLFNYVYNLCNIGSGSVLKKIARLWDEFYVDVNKDAYSLSNNAYDDPSYYIWCAIPYELLDKIYLFLENPIAKIFYLVCLSIQDTFKPQELNQKHSINEENSEILLHLKRFSQEDIQEALVKFLSADWSLNHFQFLFSYVELTEKLIKCIIETIRSERKSLSDILMIKLKYKKNEQKNILSYFFEKCNELTVGFCHEVMDYYDKRDKLTLFSELIKSSNPEALSLAVEFWEKYDNLILELKELSFEDVKKRIHNTENFNYIRNLTRSFRSDIRKVNNIIDLREIKKEILDLKRLINQKMNNKSIIYLKNRDNNLFERRFEFTLKDIKERKMELKAKSLDLEKFCEYLNKSEEESVEQIINARFPTVYYHKKDKSTIWNKIDELNWIISQDLKHKIKELIENKFEEYQKPKEEILKYPDRFHGQDDSFMFYTENSLKSPILKGLIKKDFLIRFDDLNNIEKFLSMLKTIKAKQRALFHILDSFFPEQGYYRSYNKYKMEKLQEFKEKIIKIFEPHLKNEEMEEILNYINPKIKNSKKFSENAYCVPESAEIDKEEFLGDNGFDIYDKKYQNRLNQSKEAIYSELIKDNIDISEVEKKLMDLGDGYDFRQYILLLTENNEPDYFFVRENNIYQKIQAENRKKLQKYLFYWILRQRQNFESNLSHDSISLADESNEIYDVDQGISIDNLFEDVFINSIEHGYFSTALKYLKEVGNKNWYEMLKNYTLLQLEPGITQISKVQYEYRSRLNIPINEAIKNAFEEKEINWSLLLYSATNFYNIINIQLFDLPQFLNGFKLRETKKHIGYYNEDYDEIYEDFDL